MQNTMNPEEKFKTDLLRRYKKDMHLKFFNEDASRQYVKIPIFSKLSPKKQLIPFRNTECQKPSCVYDIQDIVDKFKDSQMSSMSGFICYSCNKFVELQKFFLDITLKKIIDHIWERFNKIDKIICNGVTVMRDGHWEPNLPEYLKLLDKNQSKRKDSTSKELYVTGADDGKLKTIFEWETPPQLREFDQNEYKQMCNVFKTLNLGDNEVYMNKEGVPITINDIKMLEQEEAVSSRIIALFVNYLNLLQRVEKDKYTKKNKNRCYFSALNVVNYDKYYKKSKYEFFFGSKNNYRKDPSKIYEDFDKVVLILKYDDRWMCAAIELTSNRYYITDFLAEDLSKVKYDEVLEVVKEIAQSEFKLNYEIQEFYDHKRLNFLSDCGIYILNYVYKCMNNSLLDSVKVKFMEKDLFRKQLLWLIFKMKNLKKKEHQLFDFPESKNNENEVFNRGNLDSQRTYRNQFQSSSTRIKSNSQTPMQSQRKNDYGSSMRIFSFPGEPSFNLSNKGLDRLKNENYNSLPALHSAKNGNRVSSSMNSDSLIQFPINGYSTPNKGIRGSTLKNKREDSMIELPKDQLQEILDGFRKEVEETVKKEKAKMKGKKNLKSESSESDDSQDEESFVSEKKKKNSSSESSSSEDSSQERSSYTSLPSIYKNVNYPNYGGLHYNGYGYGGYNNYNHNLNPYGYDYSQRSETSRASSKKKTIISDQDSDEDSTDMSIFAEIIKKAKKKDKNVYKDEDLFNYSKEIRPKKDKVRNKKPKKNGKKLDHIKEEEDDESYMMSEF